MRLCNCQNDVAAQEHGEHFRTCLTLSFTKMTTYLVNRHQAQPPGVTRSLVERADSGNKLR